jgi:hypothetical protein
MLPLASTGAATNARSDASVATTARRRGGGATVNCGTPAHGRSSNNKSGAGQAALAVLLAMPQESDV